MTSPQGKGIAALSPEDARWIALFLDTEGCIVIRKFDGRYLDYSLRVTFTNTCRALVDEALRIIGAGSIQSSSTKRNKKIHNLVLGPGGAYELLRQIQPFLIVKSRQAKIALSLKSYATYNVTTEASGGRRRRTPEYTALLDHAWGEIKALNRAGTT